MSFLAIFEIELIKNEIFSDFADIQPNVLKSSGLFFKKRFRIFFEYVNTFKIGI